MKWMQVVRSSATCKRVWLWLAAYVVVLRRYSSNRSTSQRRCSCHSSSWTIFKTEIIKLHVDLRSH